MEITALNPLLFGQSVFHPFRCPEQRLGGIADLVHMGGSLFRRKRGKILIDKHFKSLEFIIQIIEALGVRHAGKLQVLFHFTHKSVDMDHDIKMGEGNMILKRLLHVIQIGEKVRFHSALAVPVPINGLFSVSAGEDLGKNGHFFIRQVREPFAIRADGLAFLKHLLTELFLLLYAHLV